MYRKHVQLKWVKHFIINLAVSQNQFPVRMFSMHFTQLRKLTGRSISRRLNWAKKKRNSVTTHVIVLLSCQSRFKGPGRKGDITPGL